MLGCRGGSKPSSTEKIGRLFLYQEMGNLERGDLDLNVSAAPDASSNHFLPSARVKY